MSSPSFDRAELTEAVAQRLLGRTAGTFRHIGEDASRRHVGAILLALEQDLAAGKRDAIRGAMQTVVEELAVHGLTFSDLRFLVQTLRSSVRAAVEQASEALRAQVDEWLFELVTISSMRFLVLREDQLQQRSVKIELGRLESQLDELKSALDEKTRLLEVIRQASTPIVPVVRGIHVVPLVGMFDTFRAELLTEKLLHEVARVHARSVILDISGVPVFDTEAAQLIIRLARAVRLLGTEVILVGMSSENARTIVELGVDLSGLVTLGTLQDGVALALERQKLQITRI
jgi:anti-anti-sigma regulatory factor